VNTTSTVTIDTNANATDRAAAVQRAADLKAQGKLTPAERKAAKAAKADEQLKAKLAKQEEEKLAEQLKASVQPAPATEQAPAAKPTLVRYAKDVPTDPATKIAYQQTNPKKVGSASHPWYEGYKSATTIAEFMKLGGTRAALRWDWARGYVKAV
jgi:hypothetical protein